MALAHCILGSFLGVGCPCFPPPLDVPTFASTCKRHEKPLSAKDGITGEKWPVNFACDFDFHVNPGFFDMPRKSATWETALLPPSIEIYNKCFIRTSYNFVVSYFLLTFRRANKFTILKFSCYNFYYSLLTRLKTFR